MDLYTKPTRRLIFAVKALAIHGSVSCALALIAAWVVFVYWIPKPYYDLARAPQLFLILLGVHVICGPLLTALLANPTKSRRELLLDFLLVILLQIGALTYGMYIIANARPVALVFEVDRFVVISASQINAEELVQAPPSFQQLSWNGPRLMGVRASRNGEETLQSIEMSFQGIEPSARPSWWQSYEVSSPQVVQRMKPVAELRQRVIAEQRQTIDNVIKKHSLSLEHTFYLPLVSGRQFDSWIVLLNSQANIVGHVPIGGF